MKNSKNEKAHIEEWVTLILTAAIIIGFSTL